MTNPNNIAIIFGFLLGIGLQNNQKRGKQKLPSAF